MAGIPQGAQDKDAWWFMFFYSVTFGGFVGLASSLTIYFNTQYGLDPKTAGFFTAACVFAGSLVRPIGGNVADRIGGIKSSPRCTSWRRCSWPSSASACPKPGGPGGVRVRHAVAGHGQRRGVPAGAPALPQGRDRRDDRPGGHGRRGRGFTWPPAWATTKVTGSYQAGFLIFAALAIAALLGLTPSNAAGAPPGAPCT